MARCRPAPDGEQLTQILESIDEAVFSFDRHWHLTYLNPKAVQLFERRCEELLGRTLKELFPQGIGTIFDREIHRAMDNREAVAFEAQRLLRPEWVDVRAFPSVVGLTIHVRDITKRKQLEDKLERLLADEQGALAEAEAERAWLQAVLDQMPEGVTLTDPRGRFRFMNQASVALSVGETGQVDPFGNPLIHDARLPSGEPLPLSDIPVFQTVERGEVVRNFEMALRQRDGRLVAIRGSSAPVCGPHGERLGTVAVFQDITALKALERERDEWISIITHDLRQPVTIILGYADRLARVLPANSAVDQRKAIDSVLTAARNLNRMIGDLLDVSRIDTRRLKLSCERVDPPTLVRAIVERASPLTGGHPIQLAIDGAIPAIDVDQSRVEQVLDNLLSNAAKYGDPGTEIVVGIRRQEGDIEVSVTNRGRGIAPEQLPKLFTRFYRTSEATAGVVKGLGLGLYIAKGLVEAHGGRIWAESIPGQTTTFTFTLPVPPTAD